MNGRQKHLLGRAGMDVLTGQRWVRKLEATRINNPLNILVVQEPDGEEDRYYICNLKNDEYFFFSREDVVSNYDLKSYDGDVTLNEQVCEMRGWRWLQVSKGEWRLSRKGSVKPPDYTKSPNYASELLESLEKYEPKIKVKMGKYTVYLDKSYTGSSREEAICKAWIDKNE